MHHHPRVHRRAVDGALEQLLEGDNPVPVVEEGAGEHLEFALADLQAQVGPRGLRAGQGLAPAVAVREHLQGQVEQVVDLPVVKVIGSESGKAILRGTVEGQNVL